MERYFEKACNGQSIVTDHRRAASYGGCGIKAKQSPRVALRRTHQALSGGLELDSFLGGDAIMEVGDHLPDNIFRDVHVVF